MTKKLLLTAGIAAALGLSAAAHATSNITFDADGNINTGGATPNTAGSLDWAVGNALIQGGIPLDPVSGSVDAQVYYQASLAGIGDTLGNPISNSSVTGLNGPYEITVIGGFGEHLQANGVGSVSLTSLAAGTGGFDNFFRVYFDPVSPGDYVGGRSSSLAGTGYGNGTLILSGTVNGGGTGNFGIATCGTINGTTCVDSGDGVTGYVVDPVLDQSSNGNDYPGIGTVTGNGSSQISIDVTYQDNNFFLTNIQSLMQDILFNTSNLLPFTTTNPSALFYQASDWGNITPTVVGTAMGSVGPINGLSGPNEVLQSDGSMAFNTTVPEPGSLALMGMGLVAFSAVARRARRKLS